MMCCMAPNYSHYPDTRILKRTWYHCNRCGFKYSIDEKETSMTTWTDTLGVEHEISKMPTPYIENCLSIIDERIPKLVKRGDEAYTELSTKREQKKEMMRVLELRRSRAYAENITSPNLTRACSSCNNSRHIIFEFGKEAELVCDKLGFTCKTVNFTCGVWEKKDGKKS